jgi:hypothetical protein
MALLAVALATVVATLGMILFAVHKFRPRSLRLKATVARWLTLTLEIEQPQRVAGAATRMTRRRGEQTQHQAKAPE